MAHRLNASSPARSRPHGSASVVNRAGRCRQGTARRFSIEVQQTRPKDSKVHETRPILRDAGLGPLWRGLLLKITNMALK